MAKLILIKDKSLSKGNKEIRHDANDIFSTSPESKQESRVYTAKELKKMGRHDSREYR